MHLVGGRAAGAQVYQPELCKAIVKGVIDQKAIEKKNRVSTAVKDSKKLRGFVRSLSSCSLGTVKEFIGRSIPVGKWPEN